MKKQASLILITLLALASFGAYAQTNEESRELSTFNGLEVSNGIEADLVRGDSYHIEISASGVDVSNVLTEIEDRQLKVKLGKGNFGTNSVKVTITYADELDKIEASTSAKVFVKDPIKSKKISFKSETSSYIETQVNVSQLSLEASTNGKISISGTAENLDLEAYTKATINGDGLKVNNAEVKSNTAAVSTIYVGSSIKGSAGTAGKVWYLGDPDIVDVKTNTGGNISRKNN